MPVQPAIQGTGPAYIPQGYQFIRQNYGDAAIGLGEHPAQIALVYARNQAQDDPSYPLLVYIAPPGAHALAGTEHQSGQLIDLGIPSVSAVYHDGTWAPGPGLDERPTGAGTTVIHWEQAQVHSITVRGPQGVYAVRGAKQRGVGFDELVKVMQSLSF